MVESPISLIYSKGLCNTWFCGLLAIFSIRKKRFNTTWHQQTKEQAGVKGDMAEENKQTMLCFAVFCVWKTIVVRVRLFCIFSFKSNILVIPLSEIELNPEYKFHKPIFDILKFIMSGKTSNAFSDLITNNMTFKMIFCLPRYSWKVLNQNNYLNYWD